jgi:hypothetical protein
VELLLHTQVVVEEEDLVQVARVLVEALVQPLVRQIPMQQQTQVQVVVVLVLIAIRVATVVQV